MSDNKSQSNDHDMSSIHGHTESDCDDSSEVFYDSMQNDTMPPVWANIVFDLETTGGERRLREMLDAGKWKLVLWEFDQWLRSHVRYGLGADLRYMPTKDGGVMVPCEDEEDMITGVLDRVRKHIHSLCDDHGIRLDED